MKPLLMRHSEPINESFKIWSNGKPYAHNPWHYHPECELTFIYKGNGVLFIGDQMINYNNDDVILIGPNLPHEWRSDIKGKPDLYSESISIHFSQHFMGEPFSKLSEASQMLSLLDHSIKGIKIEDEHTKKQLKKLIKSVRDTTGLLRLGKMLEVLHVISTCPSVTYLSSASFVDTIDQDHDDRINQVYKYVMKNFTTDLSTKDVATVINMTTTSFCRFFKERTKKQFTRYLNEVRVGYSCRLLLESKYSVSQVAYQSGFGNMSNFNKQFRMIKQITPSQFIKDYLVEQA
ncbi:Melibiose operon regulatory protein [compost metagenome]